ncbi:hypothetical protein HU200_045648 [Digitaria exilis]|uniref:OVATE domain-containing protein n=1 Tax=Digitaria exilis TaxID=1010633 RepID=A0A835B2M4_9POAL|nr:hypothetical protein HU200_045648 [Digitaria exilis]
MPLCCVECKPCNGGHCLPGLFTFNKSRRPAAQQLRRAFGKMKVGTGTRRRRRRAGSFSSVRAVFWPLMSMRSEADARNDDSRPPSASTTDEARAPAPSLQDSDTPTGGGGATVSTTAARVLALQARLAAEPPRRAAALTTTTAAKVKVGSSGIGAAAREQASGELAGDVEAACRSFERQLMEMVVEEGKVMDLTDVEELLCCWDKLRCPDFVQLVGRFYGELCMDLFFAGPESDDVSSQSAEEEEAL